MKKRMLAVAVAAAVAGPGAMAQTATLTGAYDTSYGAIDRGGAANQNGSYTGAIGNVLSTSSLSVVVNEDLGGGLKAGVQLTKFFNTATGAENPSRNGTLSSTAVQSAAAFNYAFATLSGNFGSLQLGKNELITRELGGFGRVAGNFGRVHGSFARVGDERNSAINYSSPMFAGFQVHASYAGNDSSTGGSLTTLSCVFGKSSGAGVTYTLGNFKLAAAATGGDFYVTGGSTASTSTKARDTFLAASYDFGVALVGVTRATSYLNKDITGFSSNASAFGKKSVSIVNAKVPLSGGFSLLGSFQKFKTDGWADANKAKAYQLGVTLDLSKRTTLYAVMSKTSNDANALFVTRGANAPVEAGADPSANVIGVRHTF